MVMVMSQKNIAIFGKRQGLLRVRSPKNGTAMERKIFVWHATIVWFEVF